MKKTNRWFFAALFSGLAILAAQGGVVWGEEGFSSGRMSGAMGGDRVAGGSCGVTKGSVDVKEGQPGKSAKVQYWINGFPGAGGGCVSTMELCFDGSPSEVGAKAYITTADGRKLQSDNPIRNCNKGWSRYFEDSVSGAQEIVVSTDAAVNLVARFTGKGGDYRR